MRTTAFISVVFLLLASVLSWSAMAQWSSDPALNTPVCTAANFQNNPAIASDGAGGAIIVWGDPRNGVGKTDVYAQRLDADGNEVWAGNGIAVCHTPLTSSGFPKVLEDGAGGAFVAWQDNRSSNIDIYLQRVNGSGTALWTADGIAVCTQTDRQESIQLASDGAGGVIVVWMDERASGVEDIYAQRVDGTGTPLWTADGVPVCAAEGVQGYHHVVSDGAGGLIAGWADYRNDVWHSPDIYLQRLDNSGAPLWTVDGVKACTIITQQFIGGLINDGAGGAICTWEDGRSQGTDIYAQRIDSAGSMVWDAAGVAVCNIDHHYYPVIIEDGSGGAIIAWVEENFPGTYFDIFAQRIDALGNTLWTTGGKPVCAEEGDQFGTPLIVSDDFGGAIITWLDERNGYENNDIYGQRIDPAGDPLWAAEGLAIATAPGNQSSPCVTPDGAGGIITAFVDVRNVLSDIYAQQVTGDGKPGGPPHTLDTGITCTPDAGALPFSSQMTVTLENIYTGQTRKFAAVISVEIASGASFGNWRAGSTNVAAGGNYITSWNQNIPALGTLVGFNRFELQAEDVTPAPYNQPPYPEAGCTDSSSCVIEGRTR